MNRESGKKVSSDLQKSQRLNPKAQAIEDTEFLLPKTTPPYVNLVRELSITYCDVTNYYPQA